MRHLLLTLAVLALAGVAAADDAIVARTTIGDVPRTYTHFMNAQEAALCRANAAAGGISAYFFNPAVVADISGISGQATMRVNAKSRNYLPEGDDYLDASDDVFLFSQAVAAKRNEMYALGFGYSCPSYRNLELSGRVDGASYQGVFQGGLRFFEVLAATRIGSEGQGAIGIAAGIASLNESATEKGTEQRYIRTAEMDGIATSVAVGLTFDATERLVFGVGYRFSTAFDVEGEWHTELPGDGVSTGTTKTEPVAVVGARYTPLDNYTIYASYIHEGWTKAESSFAAYYDTDECADCNENEHRRDEFGSALGTAAIGGEGTVLDGRLTVRAGFSMPIGSDLDNAVEPEYRELVPEYAAGVGGTLRFEEYSVEAAFVRELYADGPESEQVVNHGIYVTAGYDF
ncbi:MAG: hypothetical protein ABIE42_03220 [Candidatus Eisenbacteria bacterium]